MSSTYKIGGVLVIDPASQVGQALTELLRDGNGSPVYSNERTYVLTFPALTAAEWQDWYDVCDDMQTHQIYLPRRTDAAYTTDPEVSPFTQSKVFGSFTVSTSGGYAFHLLTSPHQENDVLVGAQIEVKTVLKFTSHTAG